jgi:hypothetical protein
MTLRIERATEPDIPAIVRLVRQLAEYEKLTHAMLSRLAKIAKDEDCGRMEWSVLTWNQPSIDLYHGLGAITLEDWRTLRLTGEALERLAGG